MNLNKAKVLVTGAAGFVGSHLVQRLLEEGTSIKAFVHYNSQNRWGNLDLIPKRTLSNIEVILGDVTDPFMIEKAVKGCDAVFHLASLIAIPYSYVAPQSYVMTNVLGITNIMEACRKHEVAKIVHTSTSECYGTAKYVPIDEKHPLQGQSPYSATKIAADMVAESYYRSFGLPVATIRPFNTYGPRQSARAVIPSIICQALKGNIVHLGSLRPTRDFNYVSDTVEGFIRIAREPRSVGHVINIGSGSEISIGELARLIFKLLGTESNIVTEEQRIRPTASEVERLLCDNRKAKEILEWQPAVSLEEGLRYTLDWFSSNLDRYKTDMYNI